MKLRSVGAIISQLYHFAVFASRKHSVQLDDGVLIISVDVDVGNRLVGAKNRGYNDANVHDCFSEYAVEKSRRKLFPY